MAPKRSSAAAAAAAEAAIPDAAIVPEAPKVLPKKKKAPKSEDAPPTTTTTTTHATTPAVTVTVTPSASSTSGPETVTTAPVALPPVDATDGSTTTTTEVKAKKEKAPRQGCVSLDTAKRVLASLAGDDASEQQQKKKASGPTAQDVKRICDAFLRMVVDDVKEGRSVTLVNHLTFKRVKRAGREHKVPGTQQTVHKPAHYAMVVEVKPALKKEIESIAVAVDDVAVAESGSEETAQ